MSLGCGYPVMLMRLHSVRPKCRARVPATLVPRVERILVRTPERADAMPRPRHAHAAPHHNARATLTPRHDMSCQS
eukprot:266614-Prymnesium_polylepis.1